MAILKTIYGYRGINFLSNAGANTAEFILCLILSHKIIFHLIETHIFGAVYMIAFVNGNFVTRLPSQVIVDVNGVGYDLQISLNTYSAIANKESGKLFTYLHITENAQTLYGFSDLGEKELFLQLISVSGVGASTARMMLSGLKPDEIIRAIANNNTKQLEGIKGIGKKTAERIVLELKDKLSRLQTNLPQSAYSLNTTETDALNALLALGLQKNIAENAVKKVISSNNDQSVENIIKLALKNL
jgi:Holliday junction DNA helicase RuvA